MRRLAANKKKWIHGKAPYLPEVKKIVYGLQDGSFGNDKNLKESCVLAFCQLVTALPEEISCCVICKTMAMDHLDGDQADNASISDISNNDCFALKNSKDSDLRSRLHDIQKLQQDCLLRISNLERTYPQLGIKHSPSGATSRDVPVEEKDVQMEISVYRRSLDTTTVFLDTAMKDLLRRQINRDSSASQTESTTITAKDEESQTVDDIIEDYYMEKLLFSLPDLETEIENLVINMETQTDLQMDHFSTDDQLSQHSDNVVIIYRNPSVASFLWPYLLGVGGSVLGCLVLYGIARLTLSLSIRPTVAMPVPAKVPD